ncbi:MAG: hypothetical protein Q7V10_08545 [Methanobacteriaceae archaeon]|nr:hypothetical protein [Methanobacteriaceae archaeon]MDO9627095.1 hypothetical protein [Methanobacteriaceae archaeon]
MKTRNLVILTFLFTLFLSIPTISAANVTINPEDSIQDAINNAASGDTIILNTGAYNQSGIKINKELTFKGATNNPDDVIIDAQNNDRVIEVLTGVNNVKLQGLTITNGYHNGTFNGRGAGLSNRGGTQSQPTQIINCKFTNNNATGEGGAIYNYGNLNITNCIFTNNNAEGNGGAISNRGDLVIRSSTIQQNTAPSFGGGIYNLDTMAIIDSIIQQNQAAGGGGILNDGELTITGSTIQQNQGSNGGGIDNFESLTITDSIIKDNTAPMGGGIANWNNLMVTDCSIQDNTAELSGGGIHNIMGTTTITGSNIQNNSALKGGAIYNYGNLTITSSTLQQNTATQSGAIFNDQLGEVSGTLTANFNRIFNNTPNAVECSSGSVNAIYNWWGSNNPVFSTLINGSVSYDPWLVMRYSANPTIIKQGQASNLIADFRYDSHGVFHNPAAGHLPDGTMVTFTTTLGNVGSKSVVIETINGVATAILRGDDAAGEAWTSATLDSQTLRTNVTITKAATTQKTVGMQTTGIQVQYLVLAILMVIGGLIVPKRK